jgi:hypothetical protein
MLSFPSLTVDTLRRQKKDNVVDTITLIQIAQGISNVFSVIVVALGYYALVRVTQKSVEEMRAQRLAGGRPMVIVDDNYNNLPEIDIVIRNMLGGPAKDISFEFSTPVESSSGYVITDLPVFKNGLAFLSPNSEIGVYWDHLDSLLPHLRQKGIEEAISVTTRYKDLAGYSYETEWQLNPFIYEHRRYVQHRGIGDLVDVVEKAVERLSPDGELQGTERTGPAAERDKGSGEAQEEQRIQRTGPDAERDKEPASS